MKGSAS